MRYLITGGAGFIGSHLVEDLLSKGHEVIVLDDLSTGMVENLPNYPALSFVRGSVLDAKLVDHLVRQSDAVVHLAAAVGVHLILQRPLESFITNIRGTENVLESAAGTGCKVLIASSSEVYGKSTKRAFREDDERLLGSPKVFRWAYSTSKTVEEILAFAYCTEKGLPTVVVRLFNTVGPRQTDAYGMVLPTFVSQAVAGQALTVYGDGRQTRCFCHIADVVRALICLLEEPRAVGDVFNVGSHEEISVVELARRVIRIAESASGIEFVSYDRAYAPGFEDMRRRVPDIEKVREVVGWRPQRTLEGIVTELVAEARSATTVSREALAFSLPGSHHRNDVR